MGIGFLPDIFIAAFPCGVPVDQQSIMPFFGQKLEELEILSHSKYNSIRCRQRAINSAVECHLHTVEVVGSNPISPTANTGVSDKYGDPFLCFHDRDPVSVGIDDNSLKMRRYAFMETVHFFQQYLNLSTSRYIVEISSRDIRLIKSKKIFKKKY